MQTTCKQVFIGLVWGFVIRLRISHISLLMLFVSICANCGAVFDTMCVRHGGTTNTTTRQHVIARNEAIQKHALIVAFWIASSQAPRNDGGYAAVFAQIGMTRAEMTNALVTRIDLSYVSHDYNQTFPSLPPANMLYSSFCEQPFAQYTSGGFLCYIYSTKQN